jgi:hypothetical protein
MSAPAAAPRPPLAEGNPQPPSQQQQQQQQNGLFVEDPISYLASLAGPPSQQAFGGLAGSVALWIGSQLPGSPDLGPQGLVASLYLQAASMQLLLGDAQVGDFEQEMLRTQQQYEILEVRYDTIQLINE